MGIQKHGIYCLSNVLGLETRSLAYLRSVTESPGFDPNRLLIAEIEGKPAGCIWIKGLPKRTRHELWDLAVLREFWGIVVDDALIKRPLIGFLRRMRAL